MAATRVALLAFALMATSVVLASCGAPHSSDIDGGTLPRADMQGGLLHSQVLQVGQPRRWRVIPFAPSGANYRGVEADPSGQYMWFSDMANDAMVRMAMDGTVKSFPLTSPQGAFSPGFFVFAPDRSIYAGGCIGSACDVIGVLAPDRKHFTVVHTPSGEGPGLGNQLVAASDAGVWFVEQTHVARIGANHKIDEYKVPIAGPGPAITVDGSGNTWFNGAVGQDTCQGGSFNTDCPYVGYVNQKTKHVSWFYLQYVDRSFYSPYTRFVGGIGRDPSGNVYTMALLQLFYPYPELIKVSTNGNQVQTDLNYYDEINNGPLAQVTDGANGNIWWGTEEGMTVSNAKTGVHQFVYGSQADAIAAGPDGNIWGVGEDGNVHIYIVNFLNVKPSTLTLPSVRGKAVLAVTYDGPSTLSSRSENPAIARVAQRNRHHFMVTATAQGSTTIVIRDQIGNSFNVPVTVN